MIFLCSIFRVFEKSTDKPRDFHFLLLDRRCHNRIENLYYFLLDIEAEIVFEIFPELKFLYGDIIAESCTNFNHACQFFNFFVFKKIQSVEAKYQKSNQKFQDFKLIFDCPDGYKVIRTY